MYTPQMRGVRIEIPLPIFESYEVYGDSNKLVALEQCIDVKRNIMILPRDNEPLKVIYTEDVNKLNPNIKASVADMQGLKLLELGKYKKTVWQIEDEYRYILNIFPTDPTARSTGKGNNYSHLIYTRTPPSIDGYLVYVKAASFEKMKIILGPKLVNGDREIIEALVSKFNPSAMIEESSLSGLVR